MTGRYTAVMNVLTDLGSCLTVLFSVITRGKTVSLWIAAMEFLSDAVSDIEQDFLDRC